MSTGKKLSKEEFYNLYMKELKGKQRNEEKNLKANLIFRETSEPAPIIDDRNITEILADQEKQKVLLLKNLSKITDAEQASKIIYGSNGNVGLSTAEVHFALINFGMFQKLKDEKFKFGIPAEIFRVYLNNYIEKYYEQQEKARVFSLPNDGSEPVHKGPPSRHPIGLHPSIIHDPAHASGTLVELGGDEEEEEEDEDEDEVPINKGSSESTGIFDPARIGMGDAGGGDY